ncbi:SMI1/KNR4 family protein [Nonomuraea sp. NPDC059023]|uniref:SMI1/KNR4 family protein n=1 Tax=unclassified Nonomuraea TaxID=2593643 RepID=UPI0036870FF9
MNGPDTPRYAWAERLQDVSGTEHDLHSGNESSLYPTEWLGAAPVGEVELLRHEERLGHRLPPSYREFLRVSNGWDVNSFTSVHLLPIAEVGWTRDVDPHLAATWGPPADSPIPELPDDYFFDYDAPQDRDFFEVGDYLPHTLCISENVEGSVYLLNPYIVTSGNEWEAWYLDSLYGLDAIRFRSFWHMIEHSFRSRGF